MKQRILVVEDDPVLSRVLHDNLSYEGFEVACVGDGSRAIERSKDFGPDLILLDVVLPNQDGFELFGRFRQGGPTPIIMLTALGQKTDKLRGLRLGADDYITKPFDIEELLARVQTVLRRASPRSEGLVLGEVKVDFALRRAKRGDQELHLTDREFEILRHLASHQGRIVYRNELLRAVWGYRDDALTRAVDHAIARLRKKIETDHRHPVFIHTVHGDGYRLTTLAGSSGVDQGG